MTTTLVIMAAVGLVTAGLALWYHQQRRPAPTATRNEPPSHLDRSDFRSPAAPWLVAVFTSASCSSCAAVWSELSVHESTDVVVQNLEAKIDFDIHRRYSIEDVPTAVVADRAGDIHLAIVGPMGPAEREQLQVLLAGNG